MKNQTSDRVPPHDLEAEESVLGSMMHLGEALEGVAEILQAEDFYKDKHRHLYRGLCDLAGESKPGDLVMLANRLREKGTLDRAGGSEYLACVSGDTPSPGAWEHYAGIVKGLSIRRKYINAGSEIITAAYDLSDDYYLSVMSDLEDNHQQELEAPQGFDAGGLMKMSLGETQWTVPGILPEGLTLLCGKPKQGKSFLSINIGLAVAYGGKALGEDVEYGEVLALCLEDGWRRLQGRLARMLQDDAAPDSLHFFIDWPRLDDGGIEHLENWVTQHPNCRLIIVDTLAKVRERTKGNGHIYLDDYSALQPLKSLADNHGITVLAVHHLRKSESLTDPLDEVSGSTGLTGSADAVMILKRSHDRSDSELMVVGRDMEDVELAVDFDSPTFTWQVLGPAEEYRQGETRAAIIEVVRESGDVGPKKIATRLDKNESTIKTHLKRMVDAGVLERDGRGHYSVPAGLGSV
ncbi:MAG: AAA family ATPase [Actinobacteria bacterium]|nr:AAA family ATPase [Actinomycetota bacterium]MBU4358939.1 AAA family ATPase [Actinomycetota bacterium]MCG2817862.1 AAA family ATPase [Actinomycetes bacterium]